MEKITGQELKKDLESTERKLSNLKNKIDKKFDLILNGFSQYIPENYKTYLQENSIYGLPSSIKLDVIITTEAEYVRQNNKQLDLFIQD